MLAGVAHAQPAPAGYPQPYLAHVSIQAAPATALEVAPSDRSAGVVASCTEYCDFWAVPGKYTLYALDHSSGERKRLSLRIKQSSRFELIAGDDEARDTGLVVGIVGSAAAVTGLVLTAVYLLSATCEDSNCTTQTQRDAGMVGLGLLLGGAILTPIGWTMYASNRTKLKRIDDRAYRAAETTHQVRVGVVGVGLGGLGLGGAITF